MISFVIVSITALSLLLLLVSGTARIIESDTGHVYSSGDWESLTATPGPIETTALAYSSDDNKILLYGGLDQNDLLINKVWAFDINKKTWTEKASWNCSPKCPAGRAVHSMVYDDFNNKFVVFGGYLFSGHSFETNETWTYDLATNTWTRLDFGSKPLPGARHWGSLEYNPDDHAIYLFGGHFNNANCPGDKMFNDVWKLNIRGSPTWTKMNPAGDPTFGKPTPRQADWIYNTLEDKFYVFGGKSELGPLPNSSCAAGGDTREEYFNDIWTYDSGANKWNRIQANQTNYTHYPKERRADMIYDDQNNRMVMFSGLMDSKSQYGKDTWIYDFDDDRWSTMQDADLIVPPMRHKIAAAWDDANNIMYLYGIDHTNDKGNFWRLTFNTNNISVNCFNKQPHIFGTDGNDQFGGNNVQNVIYGLAGEDVIKGGRGGDFLCGAEGDDTLFGEAGNDKLYGFDGNDEIHGGLDNDVLQGGSGNDSLAGDAGKDFFDCGSGVDTILDFSPASGDMKTADCENF